MRHSKLCSPVYKIDLQGNVVAYYYSISEAARKEGFQTVDWLRHKIRFQKVVNGFIYKHSKDIV